MFTDPTPRDAAWRLALRRAPMSRWRKAATLVLGGALAVQLIALPFLALAPELPDGLERAALAFAIGTALALGLAVVVAPALRALRPVMSAPAGGSARRFGDAP
jgi:hypothetical protein